MRIFRPSTRVLAVAIATLAAAACASTPATGTASAPAAPSAPAKPAATPTPAAVPATPPAAFGICAACHGTSAGAPPSVGPNLFGIFGRKAGAAPGHEGSDALKNSNITWNTATLTAFVTDPAKAVPNNDMDYPGVSDAATVKAIVDYMSTLK